MFEYPLDIRGVLIQKTSACRDPNWIAPFIWEGKIETQFEKLRPKIREKYLDAEKDIVFRLHT